LSALYDTFDKKPRIGKKGVFIYRKISSLKIFPIFFFIDYGINLFHHFIPVDGYLVHLLGLEKDHLFKQKNYDLILIKFYQNIMKIKKTNKWR